MEELETIKKIVKDLLEKYPHTRNSDKFMYYLLLQPVLKVITYEEFDKLFPYNFESLRRARQLIQAENFNLKCDDEVQELRDKRREEFRNLHGVEVNNYIKKGIALF
jgi:hypothetical protein